MKKYYLCLVKGRVDKKQYICGFLHKDEKTNTVRVQENRLLKDDLPIETEYEPIAWKKDVTLLKVHLITGRTHQIRCQFSARGLPLWGDKKYSTLPDDGPIALWSHCLHFAHPDTGEVLYFEQQPPDISPWSLFAD